MPSMNFMIFSGVSFVMSIFEECKLSGETKNLKPLLKEILLMMHPFAPFITEEIHSLLFDSSIIN